QNLQPAPSTENPDFPTPNMYELALKLHSEPGLEAVWSNIVKIATTCYKAERVTLAVPSDSTDLENTPWGQKATFNMADHDSMSMTYMDDRGRGRGESVSSDDQDDGVPSARDRRAADMSQEDSSAIQNDDSDAPEP